MAARISIACLKSNPATTIKAYDYEPNMHRGNVLCPDQRCRCELQGVQASTRAVNGEQIAVDAFFRLPGNAERLGRGHVPACRYNVGKTVSRLVAMSRQITRLDECAEPLLAATHGQGAEFRLHILMELLPSLRQGWGGKAEGTATSRHLGVGTSYVRSDRFRSPYLRMAKAVLSFIARVQEKPELANWIKLKYGRHTVSWDEYFFDLDRYAALNNYLVRHNQTRRVPGENRPVAVAVEVVAGRDAPTRYGHWQIRGRATVCDTTDGELVAIRPVLYVADQHLAQTIACKRHVLVCGVPILGEYRQPARSGLKPCADMSIDIIDRAQVCRYSPMLRQQNG